MPQLLQHRTSACGWFFDRSELGFYSPPAGSSTSASQNKGWCSFTRDCCLELLYKLLAAGAIIQAQGSNLSRHNYIFLRLVFVLFIVGTKSEPFILQSLELRYSSCRKFVVRQKTDPCASCGFQTPHFIWRIF